MNSRIRTTSTGAEVERIATETHIFYNAQSQDANVVFQGEEHLVGQDGSVGDKLSGREALSVSLADIGQQTFDAGLDPITGEDLSRISVAGLGNIIRAVYDALHNAQHAPED